MITYMATYKDRTTGTLHYKTIRADTVFGAAAKMSTWMMNHSLNKDYRFTQIEEAQ